MKKLILTFVLLFGFQVYAQEFKTEKKKLNKELETELNKDYTAIDHDKVTELRKKLASLNEEIKNNYIDTTKTVVYDFQKKEYTRSNVLPRVGEAIVFKIININRLAYDISIKSNDVAIVDEYFNDDIKTEGRASNTMDNLRLATATLPIVSGVNTEGLKVKSPEVSNTDKTDRITKLTKALKDKETEITLEKAAIIKSEETLKLITKEIELLLVDGNTNDAIVTKIAKKKKALLDEEIALMKKKDSLSQLENDKISITTELIDNKNTIEAADLTYETLKNEYKNILNQYSVLISNEMDYEEYRQFILNPLLNYKKYEEKVNDKNFIYYKLYKYRTNITDFEKSIAAFNSSFAIAMNNYKIMDKLEEAPKANLRSNYQQIKNEVDNIKMAYDKIDLSTKLLKVESIHIILRDGKAFETASAPIQPFEDYVTFEVDIKSRNTIQMSEYVDNSKFTYMEYTRGGVRFDFSTGVVFNFGGNNNEYEIKDVIAVEDGANVNKKEIVLTSKNDFTPMLAGMFHTSFRRSGMWAIGLTLGASLNVETFQLNSLFPGVSILIGKKQKFILTAGPSFRQVDVLKDNYETDTLYPIGDFSDTSQLTSKQFKIGGFFGITYNLTQKQRGKFKINGAE
jgi:hypothetical protein